MPSPSNMELRSGTVTVQPGQDEDQPRSEVEILREQLERANLDRDAELQRRRELEVQLDEVQTLRGRDQPAPVPVKIPIPFRVRKLSVECTMEEEVVTYFAREGLIDQLRLIVVPQNPKTLEDLRKMATLAEQATTKSPATQSTDIASAVSEGIRMGIAAIQSSMMPPAEEEMAPVNALFEPRQSPMPRTNYGRQQRASNPGPCFRCGDFPELIPLTADDQQISPEDIELTKMMYDGEFSKCWHGKLKHSRNVTVWLKKKESLNLKAVENQINILTECKHENVLALMASFFKDGHLYFVTESMSKGTLTLFLQGKEGSLLQFSQLIRIACKIAKGMSFLEEKRIVHGELSARNILVGDDIDVKIGEFHLAKREDDDGVLKDRRYRMKWTAPEVFREKRFTIKSDVWSYGILLVEIITYGQPPYPGFLSKEILGKVEEGFRHPKPKDCPDTLYSIMTKCWKKSPEERPTFEFLSDCFDDYEIYFENPYGKLHVKDY